MTFTFSCISDITDSVTECPKLCTLYCNRSLDVVCIKKQVDNSTPDEDKRVEDDAGSRSWQILLGKVREPGDENGFPEEFDSMSQTFDEQGRGWSMSCSRYGYSSHQLGIVT